MGLARPAEQICASASPKLVVIKLIYPERDSTIVNGEGVYKVLAK